MEKNAKTVPQVAENKERPSKRRAGWCAYTFDLPRDLRIKLGRMANREGMSDAAKLRQLIEAEPEFSWGNPIKVAKNRPKQAGGRRR